MTERAIKLKLEVEAAQYKRELDAAAVAAEKLAAAQDLAAKKVDHAAAVHKNAGDKVAAAEANLKKVRADSKSTSEQLSAAEKEVTKAKLDETVASQGLRDAERGLTQAKLDQNEATQKQGSMLQRTSAFWKENRADIDKTATSLMVIGGAGVGALGLMTKQAISWESAWAGVTKTVNATDEELASLQAGLRQMALELPATHEEIAAVAEAAGQLGIQTPNILGFTRTIIDLGEATNIVGEEGAKSLAQFMNIMGTSQTDVSRLGSTIVGLGNNFATTESDILNLSMRLAGAGKQAGLTESDVMGIAAAMSSVGIESEAGGTAMSTTMKRIGKEVETSGDKLGMFASVAGMTAEEFSVAWGQDAAGALSMFIDGLSNTEHLGMSTNLVLAELGVTAGRESDSLLRLSGAQGLMNEALALGGKAYADNSALAEEAGARYATTESQVRMAGNALKDAGIEVGQHVLPILADLANGVADMAGWFGALPEPIQRTIVAVGGFGSVTALAVGGTLKLAGSVADSLGAMKNLASSMPRVSSALLSFSKGAGAAGLALGALFALEQWSRRKVLEYDVESVTEKVLDLADAAPGALAAIEELFYFEAGDGLFHAEMGVDGIGDALRKVSQTDLSWGEKLEKNFAWLPGIDDQGLRMAANGIEKTDQSMASLVQSGNGERAQAMWALLSDEADAAGVSTETLTKLFPEYSAALKGAENDTRLAADATAEAEAAAAAAEAEVAALGDAFDAQAEAADAAWDALNAWISDALSAEKAAMNYEAAIDKVTGGLEQNGKTLDITTEKGRANRDILHDIVSAGQDLIKTQLEQGASEEELQGIMERTRKDLIDAATQYGMSAQEAEEYADRLGLIPENVDTEVLLGIQKAQANKEQLMKEISIAGLSLSDWMIDADGKYAIAEADGVKYKIDQKTGEIKIEGKDKNALANADKIVKKINGTTASVPLGSHGTSQGYANARRFKNEIGTGITIPVSLSFPGASAAAAQARAAAGRGVPKAADGLIRKRAWGALDEAQIQPGRGAGRFDMSPLGPVQWAEGETGGESFIPHALSKRDRALDIWEETGKILGALPSDGLAAYVNAPVSYPVAPTVSVAQVGAQAQVMPSFDVHVTVVNPFTGDQVMGIVKGVAIEQIQGNQRMVSAGSRAGRR